jgi:hypothetical protein
MRDWGKTVGWLAIFLVVLAFPVWLGAARGKKSEALPKATGESCIEPASEMRKNHPALLASWRERAVRQGDRVQDKSDGRSVRIGLSGTCLGCHGQATEFCEKCHAQAAITLDCWQCHAGTAPGAR